ncbi:Inactive homolog of metal-dependent proteases,putative molecular chaperone [Cronobacter universalis NCTC 9529]|nr:Inactive homolog of metal-dependent proteases,putative molecular chaperone [Cronobacter universalis NCTC 9529]
MAQGAWRVSGATRVLAAIDARMGEVYWAEYQRDEQGVWHGEETEAVLKPEAVTERLKALSGAWATVGTGWQAWPDMANGSGLTLTDGQVTLPAAEDMLPLACRLFEPIVVPCHRVVRRDGALSGYRWGAERKARLLAREREQEK